MEGPILIAIAVAVVSAAAVVRQVYVRQRAHAKTISPNDACVPCGGMDLERVEHRTYRCRSCDNIQGPHAGAIKDAIRRCAYAELPLDERRMLARRLLQDARLELLAAEGELSNVLELSQDDLDDAGVGGDEKLSRFAAVLGAVRVLEQKLVDVAVILAEPDQLQRLSADVSSMVALLDRLDIHILAGGTSAGGLVELHTHEQIRKANDHMPYLRRLLERLEGKLAV